MDVVTYAALKSEIDALGGHIEEDVAEATEAWLEENVDPDTGYVLDRTLAMQNAAAPADLVGDLKSAISDTKKYFRFSGSYPFDIEINKMELFSEGHYVNNSGELIESSSFNVYKYVPQNNIRYVKSKTRSGGSFSYNGVWYDQNENRYNVDNTALTGGRVNDIDYILLNYKSSENTKGYYLEVYYEQDNGFVEYDALLCSSYNTIAKNAYYNDDGQQAALKGCKVTKIDILGNFDYYLKDCTYTQYGSAYNENGRTGKIRKNNDDRLIIPSSTTYIYVNLSKEAYVYAVIKNLNVENTKKRFIANILNKPYVFDGKSAVFFGDSITKGFYSYDNGRDVTSNNYVNLFSNKVGITPTNYAVAGTTFATGTQYGSIYTAINEKSSELSDYDYIFISGGTNDFGDGNGTDIGEPTDQVTTTVYGALNAIASILNANAQDANIIFILPINRSTISTAEDNTNAKEKTLEDYRQAIYNVAVSNGYSVVDGSLFGFPTKNSDAIRPTIIFDGLHPTLEGHKQYAKALATAIV